MVKPYTWDEIKEVLVKELKKTKHILTFGTIGSCNVEHDIDVIITKKPESKSSDFYREVHKIFDNLNDYLKRKYNARAICFAQFEPESLKLSNAKERDLVLNVMIYLNYNQIKKDWEWYLLPYETITEILDSYICLIGDKKYLYSNEFNTSGYYDAAFLALYLHDRVNSNYSEKFLVDVMNKYYNLLFRKKLGLKAPIAKNKKQVREIFYKLCDTLDNLNKIKQK